MPFTLSIWLAGTAACQAGEVASPGRSAWASLIDAAPVEWTLIFVAMIVVLALLIQVGFLLRKGGMSPAAFLEAFVRAIQAGNYQEAWETCHRWRHSALARMLQPALERVGQGRESVEARLADEGRRVRKHIHFLLWSMLGSAVAVAVMCLIAASAEMHAVALAAMSPGGPRALAIAYGDIAIMAALAFAVLVIAAASFYRLRVKADQLLVAAGQQGVQLMSTLPYEEIEGVRIGQDFNAGTMLGEAGTAPNQRLQISTELTTLCPSCNGPINPSRNACPHCGQLFTWS